MKFSHFYLKSYFDDLLPDPEELARILTFHAFEVEGLEKKEFDTIMDIKVLPDRACYALSYQGLAREISAITGIKMAQAGNPELASTIEKTVDVRIENPEDCNRYSARFIKGVTVASDEKWLKIKMDLMGQRSINNVVDATNFIMLDIGQPLHAFDADKIVGGIIVRRAKEGETIELLPESISQPNGEITFKDRVLTLSSSDLVVADDEGPIALAGVKGGLRAAISNSTKNLIIESANFNPALIRATSTKYNLRNESSKRFENNISPDGTVWALDDVIRVIGASLEVNKLPAPQGVGPLVDVYPNPIKPHSISVSTEYIQERLGVKISQKEILEILLRLGIYRAILPSKSAVNTSDMNLIIPVWRRDLTIPEDIVEEVGRIYGYEKIPAVDLPSTNFKPKVIKEFYYENKIRDILVSLGFSEVYTYAFRSQGDIELEKSLASDKNLLRSDLSTGIIETLELNTRNMDLLGLEEIRIFEIGTVFSKDGEYRALAIGVNNKKNKTGKSLEIIYQTVEKIYKELNILIKIPSTKDPICWEINLTNLIQELPVPNTYENLKIPDVFDIKKYQPFSIYPFSVRDIAVFTPEGTEEKEVRNIIEKEAGKLLVRNTLFDVFTKTFPDSTKKTSYAFRLVLQSNEKTLTEEEINSIMKKITDMMNGKKDWQVR